MRMEMNVVLRSSDELIRSLSRVALAAFTPPSMTISAERGRSRIGAQVTTRSGMVREFYPTTSWMQGTLKFPRPRLRLLQHFRRVGLGLQLLAEAHAGLAGPEDVAEDVAAAVA